MLPSDEPAPSGGQTPAPGGETPAGGETPVPRGEKRRHDTPQLGSVYRLVDYLPEEWGKAFGGDSIAFHQVACPDMDRRAHLMVAQTLARDVLNQSLVALGQSTESNLAGAIGKATAHEIISKYQAKLLYRLNAQANEAKHGMWFQPAFDPFPTGSASSGG